MEQINDISNTGAIQNDRTAGQPADETLKKACREFEGLLLGVILKQSLKPGLLNEKESDNHDAYHEFAIEQAANALGQSEAIGISKLLYKQVG